MSHACPHLNGVRILVFLCAYSCVAEYICGAQDADGSTSPAHYLVELVGADGAAALGRLDVAHLADHPTAQAALAESVTVGARLGRLLVLDRMEVGPHQSEDMNVYHTWNSILDLLSGHTLHFLQYWGLFLSDSWRCLA